MTKKGRDEKAPPRALIIAPQPFFTPRGTPFSVYYRTLMLAELGVEADLLTYGEGADVRIPGVRIVRIPRFRFLGNVRTGPSLLKLFLDLFVFVWTVALLLRNRYDFVHAHEEAVFFCSWLKPIFRFRLLYDMHSSLPQQLDNFSFTKSRFIRWIFDTQERRALRVAEAVITICPELANYATGLVPDESRHFLIENSIFDPVDLVEPVAAGKQNSAQSADQGDAKSGAVLGLQPDPARRWIVYAGTLEAYQGIDLLLPAFQHVLLEEADAGLLIVGGDESQVRRFRALADTLNLGDRCLFTGRLSQTEAGRLLAHATLTVSPRSSGTNTPLKIYQQLASGIALVATDILSHTQVLDASLAMLVRPDPQDIARGLLAVLADPQAAADRARKAQELYRTHYGRDVYRDKLRALLARLLPERSNEQE